MQITPGCVVHAYLYMIVLWKIHSPLQLIDSSFHQPLQVKCCRDFISYDSFFNVLFFIYFCLTVFHLKCHRIDYIFGKKNALCFHFKDYEPNWLIDYLLQKGKYAKQYEPLFFYCDNQYYCFAMWSCGVLIFKCNGSCIRKWNTALRYIFPFVFIFPLFFCLLGQGLVCALAVLFNNAEWESITFWNFTFQPCVCLLHRLMSRKRVECIS